MWYELWDVASGNLISDFDSEAEVVEAACAYVTPAEDRPAVDVSLIVYHDDDQPVRSLEGDALTRWLEIEDERTWAVQFAATTDDQWDRMVDQVRQEIASGDAISIDSPGQAGEKS
jgi:hypothetical protein